MPAQQGSQLQNNVSSEMVNTVNAETATDLGELKFALCASLAAVASRQLVEYGATSTPLVLVRISRLVVGVFLRFPVVVRPAAAPTSLARGTCQLVAIFVLFRIITLPWRRRRGVCVTHVVVADVAVRRCITRSIDAYMFGRFLEISV